MPVLVSFLSPLFSFLGILGHFYSGWLTAHVVFWAFLLSFPRTFSSVIVIWGRQGPSSLCMVIIAGASCLFLFYIFSFFLLLFIFGLVLDGLGGMVCIWVFSLSTSALFGSFCMPFFHLISGGQMGFWDGMQDVDSSCGTGWMESLSSSAWFACS